MTKVTTELLKFIRFNFFILNFIVHAILTEDQTRNTNIHYRHQINRVLCLLFVSGSPGFSEWSGFTWIDEDVDGDLINVHALIGVLNGMVYGNANTKHFLSLCSLVVFRRMKVAQNCLLKRTLQAESNRQHEEHLFWHQHVIN